MSSVIRRFLAVAAVTGVCSLAATAQSPGQRAAGSGGFATGAAPVTPINPPPLMGVSATEETPVKDLTPGVMPGLFDPLAGESHGGGGGAHGGGGGGHGEGCSTCPTHDEHHDGAGFYGTAEYLLLRPRRGAFDFAIVDPNRDLIPGGTLESLNYEQRSAVRAGLGYRFKDSAWAAGFTYTFLRSGADRSIDAPVNGLIYPTLTRPGLVDNVGFAQATASLEYNVFDTEISRYVHVDDRLDLRLYGGARFVTIRQDFESLYDLRDANLARVTTKSNLDGFGPLMGGEATLQVYKGFHLYGKTSAAILSSRLVNPIAETNNNGQTTFAAVDYRTRRVVPMLGTGIGGGWQRRGVSVRVGYEVTNLFNAIDQIRFTNDLAEGKVTTRQADLSLEGLFVQFAVQY
ncbi:Lpg1974 family pore-forming outer membrane protein [Limnoglobus roseus]|uniref:Uncharacterized protein n=1 Tax=Limnoglobus roseus TaxID=2598579 RepID=A0A5C1A4M6_9BACT|nr:Lpg1974 family pore-forming outer membrane protein [Limnoglobus roseus]QEL13283.1 hypothetical protein PX52LOC_00137 [Limnoglobus roseus]